MCIETRLRDAFSHLEALCEGPIYKFDGDTQCRILDAHFEIKCALDELRNAPRAALVETIPNEDRAHA